MPTTALFLDLDNTLIEGSSLYYVGRGLVSRGLVNRRRLAFLAAQHLNYRLRGERPARLTLARDQALRLATGLAVEQILEATDEIYEGVLAPRIRLGCLKLAERQLAAGTQVWLATAAPVELATLIADRLSLSGALGTRSEIRDGMWTGRLAGPVLHGPAKAAAVGELVAERGWTWADCAAYSDSVRDLPLLQAVGQPAAINPDRRLRRLARERGWPVYNFGSSSRSFNVSAGHIAGPARTSAA